MIGSEVGMVVGADVGAALGLEVVAMIGVEVGMAVGLIISFSVGWGCVGAPAVAGDLDWRRRREHQSASVRKAGADGRIVEEYGEGKARWCYGWHLVVLARRVRMHICVDV